MPLQLVEEEVDDFLTAFLIDCRGEGAFLSAILSFGTELLFDHAPDHWLSSAIRSPKSMLD